jgi:nitrogen fixation NifU-like protein
VDENDIIREIAFEGEGCAICKASASMMTTTLKGKSIAESRELIDGFTLLLRGQIEPTDDQKNLGSLVVFSGIWQFPSRIKCASLAWHAACEAVTNKDGCRECPHGR